MIVHCHACHKLPLSILPIAAYPLLFLLRVCHGVFFGGSGEGGVGVVLDPAPILPQEGSKVKFRKKEENDGLTADMTT